MRAASASNGMDATDSRQKKKQRTLRQQNTDTVTNQALKNNFWDKGRTEEQTDLVTGHDNVSIRQVLRNRVHQHHQDPRKYPMSPSFYRDVKEAHPITENDGFPATPEGELVVAPLFAASEANKGIVMRKRGQTVGEVQALRNANLSEAIVVAKFYLRLVAKNEGMRGDALKVLDWMVRDGLVARFSQVWAKVAAHADNIPLQAKKDSAGLKCRSRLWVQNHRKKLGTLIRPAVIDKLLNVEKGKWSTAKQELVEACRTEIGKEIWGSNLADVLNEEVNAFVQRRAEEFVRENGIRSPEHIEELQLQILDEVLALHGIEMLPKSRQATFTTSHRSKMIWFC